MRFLSSFFCDDISSLHFHPFLFRFVVFAFIFPSQYIRSTYLLERGKRKTIPFSLFLAAFRQHYTVDKKWKNNAINNNVCGQLGIPQTLKSTFFEILSSLLRPLWSCPNALPQIALLSDFNSL